jgi:phosphoribosylglycinamide formyltransferase-1
MMDPMKRFVGEALRPVAETFDAARMAAGGPGLPGEFVWRGGCVRVARVLNAWRETAPCRHGSGERYVSRHWFDVLTGDGETMRLYFERRARGRALSARWWLFSVETDAS